MKLSIFDTFKTKGGLTGEANRQRSIISILSSSNNPMDRTRTGMSQLIGKKQGIVWKNIYSGIFRDLDEILIPMGLVMEHGRLPLRRGPKALQENGMPYYHLTKKGILVALATCQITEQQRLLDQFFAESDPKERRFEGIISKLQEISPNFTASIFQKYVRTFCEGKFEDLLPFDLSNLGKIADESLIIQKEIFDATIALSKQDMEETARLLDEITLDDKH